MKLIRRILKRYCRYKWVRKYLGGYWECWYIDILHCDIWFSVNTKLVFDKYGFRPGCGYGTPFCEYYPVNFFDTRDKFNKEQYKRVLKLNRILGKN